MKKANRNIQRILVTYYSLSNNTQLLANTLRDYLSTKYDVTISKIGNQNPSELDDYDLVLIGSPCHDSDLALSVKNFMNELPSNPHFKLAGFYCHATYRRKDSHPKAISMFDEWAARGLISFKEISIEKNIDLLGVFNCMGTPSQPIMEFIHQEIIPDEKEYALYRQESLLHPSQDDLDELVDFAERIIKEI